jgi:N-acetylglutamate synthase-like GNAT family acetyltransferase
MCVVVQKAASEQRKEIISLLRDSRIGRNSLRSIRGMWVAMVGTRVVGTTGIDVAHGIAVIHSVAIEKALRRQGIGLRLVTHGIAEAQARGAVAIALVTMFWNVNFFRHFGFRAISRKNLPGNLRELDLFSSPKYRFTIPMLLDTKVNQQNLK